MKELDLGKDGLIKTKAWYLLKDNDHVNMEKIYMEENDNATWNQLKITLYTNM